MKNLFWVLLVSAFLALCPEGFAQVFTDDFESGSITRSWREEGSTTSVSTKYKLGGKYSFRAYLETKLYNNARSELRFEGGNNVPKHQDFFTIWGTSVAIYVPENFQPDYTSREMIIQYHGMPDPDDTYKSPTFAIYLDGYELQTRIRYIKRDPGTPDDQETIEYSFGQITPGKWHFFVMDIRWDYRVDGNGFVKIYFRKDNPPSVNNLVVDYNGRVGSPDDRGPYFKMGVYKWDWKQSDRVNRSRESGVTHRELFYDNISMQKGAFLTGKGANNPPIVDAGSGKTITLPTNTVSLVGSARDNDGTISSIQWQKISGGTAYIETPNKEATTVSNLSEGTYTFEIKATDNDGATSTDRVNVTVLPETQNESPRADAGPDKTITLPVNWVQLNGSGTDPDGTIEEYSWKKMSGGNAVIVSPSSASTEITDLEEGEYEFRLIVRDNDGDAHSNNVKVTVLPEVANQRPLVNAGQDQNITLPLNSVDVEGSATDPDGNIERVLWSQTQGGNATIVNPESLYTKITDLEAGTYEFRLQAWDNDGDVAGDRIIVTVLPEAVNQRPVVNAGQDIQITLPENTVTVNGTASDPDGTISSTLWEKISGGTVIIEEPSKLSTRISNLTEGTYTFRLTARDNSGETSADNITVTVLPEPNELPVVTASGDITITLPENTVSVSATASDEDGAVSSVQWTRVSGGQANIVTPGSLTTEITDLQEGSYTFRITATDDDGGSGSDELTVTVLPSAELQAPVVSAGNDQTIGLPETTAELQGSASDADGNIVSVKWTQVSGPAVTIVSPNTYLTEVTGLTQGTFEFDLEATDNDGLTGNDRVKITVRGENMPPVVNAGGDISLNLPVDFYELTAEAYDPDGEIVSYEWIQDKGEELVLTGSNSAVLRLEDLGVGNYTFRVVVTDDQGARAEDVVRIKTSLDMNKVAGIPRVFSPDGNGIDDYWIFDDASITEGCNIVIFNRQGRNVYEAASYANDWDGTYNGTPLPEGDYYYVINCEDEEKPLTGGVRILRQ